MTAEQSQTRTILEKGKQTMLAVRGSGGMWRGIGVAGVCLGAIAISVLSFDSAHAQGDGQSPVTNGQTNGSTGGIVAPKLPANAGEETDPVQRGRYIAAAADCAACHTAPKHGKPFAGGYSLQTPFGKIVASNITSDKETGIGTWTETDFIRAVRQGKRKNGENLYPAMPYNDYVKITDRDMHDLWAYISAVPPVNNKVVSNQLPFPYNIRFLMTGWNLMFFDKSKFKLDPTHSVEWNRGAYLVQGLGHCAACHTPKNFLGGDKTSAFLQGGDLIGWHAPEITSNSYVGIGKWTNEQVVQYLATGSNHVAIAAGPMAEAVSNSTQHMSEADLHSISTYLRTLPGSETMKPLPLTSSSAQMVLGARVYAANCAACHASSGKGIPGIATSFPGNPAIQAPSSASLLTTVLAGGRGAVTLGNPTSAAMPSFAWKLSDKEIAAVVTYVRNQWGNSAGAVQVEDVTKARAQAGVRHQLTANAK